MDNKVSLSIIDIMGLVGDGVGILLSLKVADKIYELIYWFDAEENFRLVADLNFMTDYKLGDDIYSYKNLPQLVKYIENTIPNKNEILIEYGLK